MFDSFVSELLYLLEDSTSLDRITQSVKNMDYKTFSDVINEIASTKYNSLKMTLEVLYSFFNKIKKDVSDLKIMSRSEGEKANDELLESIRLYTEKLNAYLEKSGHRHFLRFILNYIFKTQLLPLYLFTGSLFRGDYDSLLVLVAKSQRLYLGREYFPLITDFYYIQDLDIKPNHIFVDGIVSFFSMLKVVAPDLYDKFAERITEAGKRIEMEMEEVRKELGNDVLSIPSKEIFDFNWHVEQMLSKSKEDRKSKYLWKVVKNEILSQMLFEGDAGIKPRIHVWNALKYMMRNPQEVVFVEDRGASFELVSNQQNAMYYIHKANYENPSLVLWSSREHDFDYASVRNAFLSKTTSYLRFKTEAINYLLHPEKAQPIKFIEPEKVITTPFSNKKYEIFKTPFSNLFRKCVPDSLNISIRAYSIFPFSSKIYHHPLLSTHNFESRKNTLNVSPIPKKVLSVAAENFNEYMSYKKIHEEFWKFLRREMVEENLVKPNDEEMIYKASATLKNYRGTTRKSFVVLLIKDFKSVLKEIDEENTYLPQSLKEIYHQYAPVPTSCQESATCQEIPLNDPLYTTDKFNKISYLRFFDDLVIILQGAKNKEEIKKKTNLIRSLVKYAQVIEFYEYKKTREAIAIGELYVKDGDRFKRINEIYERGGLYFQPTSTHILEELFKKFFANYLETVKEKLKRKIDEAYLDYMKEKGFVIEEANKRGGEIEL